MARAIFSETRSANPAAMNRSSLRPIGASGQIKESFNHHLDSVFLGDRGLAVREETDVDLLAAGIWNSARERVLCDHPRPFTRLLCLKRNASAFPTSRIGERASRNTETMHICGNV